MVSNNRITHIRRPNCLSCLAIISNDKKFDGRVIHFDVGQQSIFPDWQDTFYAIFLVQLHLMYSYNRLCLLLYIPNFSDIIQGEMRINVPLTFTTMTCIF